MSVIGPRPGLWNQDILTAERDKYNANDVKPGLTGWAQINGRDELEIPDKAKLDGEYVSKMDNRMYSEHAYQSDPEGDEPSADITLDEVGLCKGQKFALHYDFGDDWMFTITVSKISEVQEDFEPRVIKSKGTVQQYPDWDEEDFDEE